MGLIISQDARDVRKRLQNVGSSVIAALMQVSYYYSAQVQAFHKSVAIAKKADRTAYDVRHSCGTELPTCRRVAA